MKRKPQNAVAGTRPRRLSSVERRKQITEGAIAFFADEGFEGGTRALAQQLGITQPLLYRYFPSKGDLVREVYQQVFIGKWQSEWIDIIGNPARPLKDRLVDFYTRYTEVIFSREFLRIYLFAGLKGLEINPLWVRFVEEQVIRRICIEVRKEASLPTPEELPITSAELELFWSLHGGIFFYGFRRDVCRVPVHLEVKPLIVTMVEMLLSGLPATLRRICSPT